MTVPGNIEALMLGGGGYQIERSLRFNSPDSAYCSRAFPSAGNQKTWSWSAWIKRSSFGSIQLLFQASNDASIGFNSDNTLTLNIRPVTTNYLITTTQVFRDPSAWYHIVCTCDTTLATADDRLRMWVNGVQVTTFASRVNPTQNMDGGINNASTHYIGKYYASANYFFDGYLTEINFIDGQALTPSSFGETDTITGVWKPKKYSGSGYGTNGFYLNFKDNSSVAASTLGKDYSGNGNNWTPSATFSVTPGAGNDSLIDTPTPYADGGNGRGNYAVINSVSTALTTSDGNLKWTGAGSTPRNAQVSIALASGKWYWEFVTVNNTGGGGNLGCGVSTNLTMPSTVVPGNNSYGYELITSGANSTMNKNNNSSFASISTYAAGNVWGIAIDVDTGKMWFSKNGTWISGGNPAAGTTPDFTGIAAPVIPYVYGYNTSDVGTINFGQQAFIYTPPAGFLALNTQNLPEPSIKKPSSYFNTLLYTGNSATSSAGTTARTLTGLGFQPDLIWVKSRNNGGTWSDHSLTDTVRGANLSLSSNTTGSETNVATGFSQGGVGTSTSDGFTIVSGTAGGTTNLNSSSGTYVAWCWDESATPGFDIVTFTGNGSAPATISHSLGVAPSMMIVKNRDQTGDWVVYHSSITNSQTGGIFLNLTNAWGANSTYFNNSVPTSSNFQVGSYFTGNNIKYVAYLWSEVAGMSKFGSYTGNGSTDGPFVFTGHRSRFLLVKRSDSTANWTIRDTARRDYNSNILGLFPNLSAAEDSTAGRDVDMLSNGFKIRGTDTDLNASGGTYVFAAFSESAFKYSLAR